MTSVSLLATATALPASSAGEGALEAGGADDGGDDDVGVGVGGHAGDAGLAAQ